MQAGQWFSLGPPVSSTNKTDCHDISEILFKSGVKHHKTKPNQKTNNTYNEYIITPMAQTSHIWLYALLSIISGAAKIKYNDWLIDWCLMPTLAIFQLYHGVKIQWTHH